MLKFADLHIHTTLKPFSYYSADKEDLRANIWHQDQPKKRQRDNDLVRYTQADFTTLVQSGVKIVFAALYPMEQGWVGSFNTGLAVDIIARLYTHFPIKRINQIQNENYNYFNELQKEFIFLKKQISEPQLVELNGTKKTFYAKMPINNQQFENFMNEENTIIVIPTIEGANSLISGNSQNTDNFSLAQTLNNIQTIKNWHTRPFFVTLAHHFYNGLCGHSKSIFAKNKIQGFLLKLLVTQAKGIDSHITPKGKKVIESLLEIGDFKNKHKRIFIDVKHMNEYSRSEFYQMVLMHNQKNPDDQIPVISSHSAYSGIETFAELKQQDSLDNKYFSQSDDFFNQAKINLCNQDIKSIFASKGLIGINIDERILSNKKIVDIAKRKFNYKLTNELRTFWAEQIVRNISSMANVIFNDKNLKNKNYVWDMFCLGSDFDGFINPVDAFITTKDYDQLQLHLKKAFVRDKIFNNNNFGLSAQQLSEKIVFKNALNFFKKYYYNSSNRPKVV